jgi:hypothetical protein
MGKKRPISPYAKAPQDNAAVWNVDSYIAAIATRQQVRDVVLRRGSTIQPSPLGHFASEQYRDNRLAPLLRAGLGPDFLDETVTIMQTNPITIGRLARRVPPKSWIIRDGTHVSAIVRSILYRLEMRATSIAVGLQPMLG